MIGECIAYEEDDDNQRYYEVIGTEDFIADYYVNGEMEQINFMRKEYRTEQANRGGTWSAVEGTHLHRRIGRKERWSS